ncbi:MAG: chorismate lyase, partial [Magnetococcales bacterium]|nr:chorismate lyase [Magnetococcales bacterium]
ELGDLVVAPRYREMLASTDSLTRRLENLTGLPSRVRLEEQSQSPAESATHEPWDPAWLATPESEPILIRAAWLRLGDVEMVFAHSRLSLAGMDPRIQQAIEVGDQPLGSLFLARDEQVERRHLQLAACRAPVLAERIGRNPGQPFILRRSLFLVAGQPRGRILELFLTDLSR